MSDGTAAPGNRTHTASDERAPATAGDRLGGALWMSLGLAIVAGAWQMDRYTHMGGTLYTAPGLVPGIYGLLMMALGAALALRKRAAAASPTDELPAADSLLNRRMLWALALTLAYGAVLIGRAPFGPSTACFVATFSWIFNEVDAPRRRVLVALASGVITALVVVLVFERVFLVRLP